MGNNSSSQTAIPLQGTLIPTRTTSRLGQRVLREGVWRRDSQDGDAVHVGTLIAVGNPFTYGAAPSTVWVAWDDGKVEKCRTSRAGHCDLRLYDSGPAGIHFPSITCDACSKADIGGTRWKCGECYDYDLCHACYMADKHSLEHAFLRYDVPGATGIKVNARMGSMKLNVRGIFEGAKVVRGPHWKGGSDDGTEGTTGTVLSVRDGLSGTVRSRARVQWSGAYVETYSVGHSGDVALKCVQCAAGGAVYVDHMPLIGPVQLKDHSGSEFFAGALVCITLDVETFRLLQNEHGGWVPELMQVINKIGVVQDVTATGDVRVCFGSSARHNINPAALLKVPIFSVGDRVKVVEDLPTVRSRETNSVFFQPRAKFLGRIGTVTDIWRSQVVLVNVDGCDALFNPLSLASVPRQTNGPGPSNIATAAKAPSSSGAQRTLEMRLRELEEARRCAICMDHQRDVLFLCGHGCCEACSRALKACHVCRNPITKKIPIF